MASARTLTLDIPADIADALHESVRSGEFASEGDALIAAAKYWQSSRDLIERQNQAIRRDIKVSLDDPRASVSIDEVERMMERYTSRSTAAESDANS